MSRCHRDQDIVEIARRAYEGGVDTVNDLDVVREAHEAFSRGDFDGFLSLVHPEVEWIGDDLTGRTHRGHAGVREWADDVFSDLTDVELEIHELVRVDGRIFIAFSIHAQGRSSGISGALRRGAVATVEGGKITYYRSYPDEQQARVDAGLPVQ